MSKMIDLTGKRFGRLVVVKRHGTHITKSGSKSVTWECRCDCGGTTIVSGYNLKRGHTKSCGCIRKEMHTTHGQTDTRLFHIWQGIKTRCYTKTSVNYKKYGAKGITMCDEWKDDFRAFYRWSMANGYLDELSIDRIDGNKGYSPDNCRWADIYTQNQNRTFTKKEKEAGENHGS